MLRFSLLTAALLTLTGCPLEPDEVDLPALCRVSNDCCEPGATPTAEVVCHTGRDCEGGTGVCRAGYGLSTGMPGSTCICAPATGGWLGDVVVDTESRSLITFHPPRGFDIQLPEIFQACPDAVTPVAMSLDGGMRLRTRKRGDAMELSLHDSNLRVRGELPCLGQTEVRVELRSVEGTVNPKTGALQATVRGELRTERMPFALRFETTQVGHVDAKTGKVALTPESGRIRR